MKNFYKYHHFEIDGRPSVDHEELPQVCPICRKMKPSKCGKFIQSRVKKRWVCSECLEKRETLKRGRQRRLSPPERLVLSALIEEKFVFECEFKVENFFFDFALPHLRVLIEIDSYSYHKGIRAEKDGRKAQAAKKAGWDLLRFKPSKRLKVKVLRSLMSRRDQLGFNQIP